MSQGKHGILTGHAVHGMHMRTRCSLDSLNQVTGSIASCNAGRVGALLQFHLRIITTARVRGLFAQTQPFLGAKNSQEVLYSSIALLHTGLLVGLEHHELPHPPAGRQCCAVLTPPGVD